MIPVSDLERKQSSISDRFKQIALKNRELESETNPEYATRIGSQIGARTAETVLGYPGNLKNAFRQFLDTVSDIGSPGGSELFQKQREGVFGPEQDVFNPPTSSEIREKYTPKLAEKLTGKREYFEPKTKGEEKAGRLTQDITSFFLPGTRQLRLATRLGAPILGNLAQEGLTYVGVDEQKAEKAKLGVMLATTLAGQSNPAEFARNRIAESKNMIPETATVPVAPLANSLMPLYNRLQRGLGVPSKSRAVEGMRDLAGQVQGNRINLRSLMQARDDINEWISEAGGWDIPANTRDATLRNLNELKTQVIRTVENNLQTRFPQAADLYRTGYEAAAVTHRSNAISNFIEKHFGKKVASVGVKLLFPAIGGAALIPKTTLGAVAAYPAYKAGQVLYRVGQSPTLARYYQDVIRDSTIGNSAAMIKSMAKLDKALAEEEEKDRKKEKPSLEQFKSKFKKGQTNRLSPL